MLGSWVVLGLIAALGGAGVAIFGKVGLEQVDPTLATTARSLVMAAVLLGVSLATGRFGSLFSSGSGLDRRGWTFIVMAGLAGAISWLAYFWALRVGAAAQVASIDRLSVAFVVIFAALFLGERYGWRGWMGVALVAIGLTMVATDPTHAPSQASPAVSESTADR